MSQVVGLPNNSYKPITNTTWVRAQRCKLQKGCTRLAAASDKVYQLFAHGRWFSPGTLASSTTKTGRHDIDEILLKVALNTKNQSNQSCIMRFPPRQIGFFTAISITVSMTICLKKTPIEVIIQDTIAKTLLCMDYIGIS